MVEYALMLLMALLWAGAFVVSKLAVSTVPPEMVAFLRFFVSAMALVPILAIWQRDGLRLKPGDWKIVLALGACGVAMYNLLFYVGIHYSRASDGSMIIPTMSPVLTHLLSVPILGEPLRGRKAAGAVVSVAGQSLIFWGLIQAVAHDPGRLLGDLMFLGSALCWACYGILGRIAARRFTALAATTWATLAGSAMLLPVALWRLPGSTGYTPQFWGAVLYLALGSTVAAYIIWSRGIARLGASLASVFMNMVPVFALVLANLVLGERTEPVQVIGMLVVVAGVVLASTARAPAAAARPAALPGENA